jgi:hypothetical protein
MTTDNFCFCLQNRLIQTSQTGGQQYRDTSPFSIPCTDHNIQHRLSNKVADVYANPFTTYKAVLTTHPFGNKINLSQVPIMPTNAKQNLYVCKPTKASAVYSFYICGHDIIRVSNCNQDESAATFCCQVAGLVQNIFCNFCFVKKLLNC